MEKTKVLLTGISGFLGSHTAIQLLNKGYQVTGTLRNLKRADAIRNVIAQHTTQVENLHFAEADLLDTAAWTKLAQGMDYVLHVASPFPRELPKTDAELIEPARQGTLNILHAAAQNNVKRVVIVSSVAAVSYGKTKAELSQVFDETSWTDETNLKDTTPYFRSKTIAEKAAWEFVKNHPSLEIATVCPGAILGPVLEEDFGTSANIVIKLLDRSAPAVPKVGFEIVDVRSVADLLIRAMADPRARNQRYIASAGYMKFKDVAQVLKTEFPDRKIPQATLPNFLVRFYSAIDQTLKPILIDLDVTRKMAITKAARELGWQPISKEEAAIACAHSVIKLGLVK
jgi:dihydroflavonol-4-reductase